jgi:hypothetical protein
MLAGTSVGSFTPENFVSYVVQRGVGISIARAYWNARRAAEGA